MSIAFIFHLVVAVRGTTVVQDLHLGQGHAPPESMPSINFQESENSPDGSADAEHVNRFQAIRASLRHMFKESKTEGPVNLRQMLNDNDGRMSEDNARQMFLRIFETMNSDYFRNLRHHPQYANRDLVPEEIFSLPLHRRSLHDSSDVNCATQLFGARSKNCF